MYTEAKGETVSRSEWELRREDPGKAAEGWAGRGRESGKVLGRETEAEGRRESFGEPL